MVDILIIGSGPAGLSAAVYGKRANLSVKVAEKVFYGTGQVAESHRVDNYLGFFGINGYDLGEKFREHAQSLEVEFVEEEAVSYSFDEEAKIWNITYKSGNMEKAKTVIYAGGAVHRHLDIPGESEFGGRGVSYCATCDGAFFRGKKTVVIGGGDTALDDALYLSEIADKVYLVHRREGFRGSSKTVAKLREKENVEFVLNAKPIEIIGENTVSGLKIYNTKTETESILSVNGVFIAVGMVPMTQNVGNIVELDKQGYIIAGENGVTSTPGFFVAGDVRTKALRQVVTAVSDGANAATSAEQYIRCE